MTMTDALRLVLALVTGLLLGAIFFGGLWWTVRKGDALYAAGKEGDPVPRGTARLLDGGDDGVGKMPADGDRLPLELAEPPGKEGEEPRPAQQPAEPAGLVEPEQPARRVERPRAEQEERY